MKFAFCLFNYFPYGGLQRDFLRITHECLRRGHAVDIYTMRWEGERDPALSITIIPTRGWQNHTQRQYFVEQLQIKLAKKSYDMTVGFNKMPGLDVYYAADTCFLAKAEQQHGMWYRFTPRYRQLAAFEKAVFTKHLTTEILLISPKEQAEFVKYYQTETKRFHLLPPGISRDRLAPSNAAEIRDALRQEFNIAPDHFLLLIIGSGFKAKGLDRALLSVAALPTALKNRVHLFVIGKDHAEPFQRQVRCLKISAQVQFLNGRDDVPRFLLGADLLVHPAYNENTGTVLLEALTSGLPVLTTDVCGYAHYIQEANAGIVLPSPFQQAALNQVLKDMLLSPERALWQKNAILFAQHADIYSLPERAVDIMEDIFKNIIKS